MSTKKHIHLRVWSNNKWDRDSACGLFWRGNERRWSNDPEQVTCEDCKKQFHKWNLNPDGTSKED